MLLGLGASAAVIAALLLILFAPGNLGYFMLALVYAASALPFFFAGAVVSISISEAMERVDRAYFWDLAGAAAGCLALIPFLHYFGGPNTVISAAVLYLVSAAIWFHQAAVSGGGGVRRRATAVLLALLLVMLMVVNGKTHIVDVRTAKGQRLPTRKFHRLEQLFAHRRRPDFPAIGPLSSMATRPLQSPRSIGSKASRLSSAPGCCMKDRVFRTFCGRTPRRW